MTNYTNFTDRKFGIEIEFVGADVYAVEHAINEAGVNCRNERWNHETRGYWKIVSDSSIHRVRGHGGELVSPILAGVEGVKELETVLDAMNSVEGVTVNRSCGLHVHLDTRDMTAPQIIKTFERYANCEAQIDLAMPRSRRGQNAEYCRSIASAGSDLNRCRSKRDIGQQRGRFYKVNVQNVYGRGSIEFRQHSGTTDVTKVTNWLAFLMNFVERSIELAVTTTTPKARWFNAVRNTFENAGFDLIYSRRLKKWEVSTSEGIFGTVTNGDLAWLYHEDVSEGTPFNGDPDLNNRRVRKGTLLTNKANGASINRSSFESLLEELGIERSDAVWRFNFANQIGEAQTDEGHEDKIPQDVVDYLNERKEELGE